MSSAQSEAVVKSAVPLADLSALDEALKMSDDALRDALKRVRPADVGRDLSRRSIEEGRRFIEASDDRHAAAILKSAHPQVAGRLIAECSKAHAGRTLAFLTTDQQVRILGTLAADDRAKVQGALEPDEQKNVERLLAYPESAVARLMTPKVFCCAASTTAREALELLRTKQADIEVAQNCYVTGERDRLVGVVPLRELAVADPDARLDTLMTPNPIAVSEKTERGDAAEIVQAHDFLSLPVIDDDGRLVGAVRVDDLLDAALSKVGVGALNQGGVAGDIAATVPYFQTSILRVVRSRITWLVLLFVAETATGTVLRHFEDELSKVVALAFFIPLLIGTGGNAGSRTVSTIIRALALGEVRMGDVFRVLLKEILSGVLLGICLGVIALGRAKLWGVDWDLAACVGVTVLVVCTWANTVGAVIPIAAQRMKIDPTVISGPLITTLVDASGLFLYLTIAKLMIAQLRGG